MHRESPLLFSFFLRFCPIPLSTLRSPRRKLSCPLSLLLFFRLLLSKRNLKSLFLAGTRKKFQVLSCSFWKSLLQLQNCKEAGLRGRFLFRLIREEIGRASCRERG